MRDSGEQKYRPLAVDPDDEPVDLLPEPDETLSDPRSVVRKLILGLFLLLGILFVVPIFSLIKLWPVKPYYQEEPVKISLLDYIQAVRLCQAAAAQAASGSYNQALRAYALALANYPGYLEAAKHFIETAAEVGARLPLEVDRIEKLCRWVLAKTGTNHMVLEKVVRMLDQADLSDQLLRLLDQSGRAAEFPLYYAKALLLQGQLGAAIEWSLKVPDRPLDDPALEIYRLAFIAGWGPYEKRAEAKRRLSVLLRISPYGPLAKRLLLTISRMRGEHDTYHQTLQMLTQAGIDDFLDHLGYVETLIDAGDLKKARQYAANFPKKPQAPEEVTYLAAIMADLGLYAEAQALIEKYTYLRDFLTPQTAYRYWAIYGAILAYQRQGKLLLAIGDQLLRDWPQKSGVYSLGLLYMAMGYHIVGRFAEANDWFSKMVNTTLADDAQSAIRLAKSITSIGYPSAALTLLRAVETSQIDNFDYWLSRFHAAWLYGKDYKELLLSSERMVQLAHNRSPSSFSTPLSYEPTEQDNGHEKALIAQNNLAATLLLFQTNLHQAISLTFQLMLEDPNNLAVRVNHAFALALVGRLTDAEQLLGTITYLEDPTVYNTYIQTSALITARKGDRASTEQALAQLNMGKLTHIEKLWIDAWMQGIRDGRLLPPPAVQVLIRTENEPNG